VREPNDDEPRSKRAQDAKAKILFFAKQLLADRLGVIATSRMLSPFRYDAENEIAELLIVFAGIDSETDSLPVGAVREYWAPEALARKDTEIAEAENLYRNDATEAAISLVALLEEPS
jgi:hypothetical protein